MVVYALDGASCLYLKVDAGNRVGVVDVFASGLWYAVDIDCRDGRCGLSDYERWPLSGIVKVATCFI